MTNPISLIWFAFSQSITLVIVGLLAVAIVAAVVVFGGGWS